MQSNTKGNEMNTIEALAKDALADARIIVFCFDPYGVADQLDSVTLGMKRLALLEARADLVEAIDRMRIIHQAALAYATGRSYEVPR